MNGQEELCALIFTKRRFTAKVIFYILDHLSKHSPKYSYMKLDFIVGYNINPYNDTRELLYTVKKNRSILQSFNNKEINILVASNVLEEGIDVQSCSLVIKYDHPEEYRSYIQSKGRARNPISQYYLLVEDQFARAFEKKYQEFRAVENILQDVSILIIFLIFLVTWLYMSKERCFLGAISRNHWSIFSLHQHFETVYRTSI